MAKGAWEEGGTSGREYHEQRPEDGRSEMAAKAGHLGSWGSDARLRVGRALDSRLRQ